MHNKLCLPIKHYPHKTLSPLDTIKPHFLLILVYTRLTPLISMESLLIYTYETVRSIVQSFPALHAPAILKQEFLSHFKVS